MTLETWAEAVESFDELLDADGPLKVAGLEFWPSRILKELDPIAYRSYLMDTIDAAGIDSDSLAGELNI